MEQFAEELNSAEKFGQNSVENWVKLGRKLRQVFR